jgi:hypothetical protein
MKLARWLKYPENTNNNLFGMFSIVELSRIWMPENAQHGKLQKQLYLAAILGP